MGPHSPRCASVQISAAASIPEFLNHEADNVRAVLFMDISQLVLKISLKRINVTSYQLHSFTIFTRLELFVVTGGDC